MWISCASSAMRNCLGIRASYSSARKVEGDSPSPPPNSRASAHDPEVLARVMVMVIVSGFFGVQHTSDVLTGPADLMERYAGLRDALFKGFIFD